MSIDILSLDSEINFGKYEGVVLEYVIDHDIDWVTDCLSDRLIRLDFDADKYYLYMLKLIKNE